MSRVPASGDRRAVLAYLGGFRSGFFAITNPTLGIGAGLRWPLETFGNAWLWQEVVSGEGFPWFRRAYVVAVEPASTTPGQGIANARAKGSRGVTLTGFSSREVVLEAVLFEGTGPVADIAEGGSVKFSPR